VLAGRVKRETSTPITVASTSTPARNTYSQRWNLSRLPGGETGAGASGTMSGVWGSGVAVRPAGSSLATGATAFFSDRSSLMAALPLANSSREKRSGASRVEPDKTVPEQAYPATLTASSRWRARSSQHRHRCFRFSYEWLKCSLVARKPDHSSCLLPLACYRFSSSLRISWELQKRSVTLHGIEIQATVGDAITSLPEVTKAVYDLLYSVGENFFLLLPILDGEALRYWFVIGNATHGHIGEVIIQRESILQIDLSVLDMIS
jgi:hypothetical protein